MDLNNTERELAHKKNNKTRGQSSDWENDAFQVLNWQLHWTTHTNTSFFWTEMLSKSEFQRDLTAGSIDLLYEQFDGLW